MKSREFILVSAVAAVALFGCGVARSTSAILKARQEYEAARMVDARSNAPYHFTLGEEYLRKAQEEAGYSDYQVAEGLAQQAQGFLSEAKRQSVVVGSEKKPAGKTGLED